MDEEEEEEWFVADVDVIDVADRLFILVLLLLRVILPDWHSIWTSSSLEQPR